MPSFYEFSIQPMLRGIDNLTHILQKAEQHAKDTGVDPEKYLQAQLVDDMKGLPFQIQRVSDTAKGTAVRVGGLDPVPFEDNETTFAQLHERLQKTKALLLTLDRADFDKHDTKHIPSPSKAVADITFSGASYVATYALPNFYFHVMAAYAILRKEGVPVGKLDYLGRNFDEAKVV